MSTLIVNTAFALGQQKGISVFTEIQTKEESYSESEINIAIEQINEHKKKHGFLYLKILDETYKSFLRKTPKKIKIKKDYPRTYAFALK